MGFWDSNLWTVDRLILSVGESSLIDFLSFFNVTSLDNLIPFCSRTKGLPILLFSLRALAYLVDSFGAIRGGFNMAFAECAMSAYEEFPIMGVNSREINSDIPNITMDTLIDAKRPKIDSSGVARVLEAIEKTRGFMSIEDKLAYMVIAKGLEFGGWSTSAHSPHEGKHAFHLQFR